MSKGKSDASEFDESYVSAVCNVFPDRKRSEVVKALESSHGNLEDACAILLAEPVENETDGTSLLNDDTDTLHELQVMFPDTDLDKIEAVYNHCQSIDTAITELLSLPLLQLEDGKEQEKAEKQAQTNRPSRGVAKEGFAWKSVPEKIKKIRQFTAVPDSSARQAFHESSFNVTKAIIKIIWTTTYYGEDSRASTNCADGDSKQFKPVAKSLRGGRVQSAAGFAHAAKHSYETPDGETKTPHQLKVVNQDAYIFSTNSREARELEEILQINSALRSINRAFLKRALTFYRGDLSMATSLALHIIDADLQSATFKARQKDFDSEKDIKITTKFSQRQQTPSVERDKPSQLQPLTFHNQDHCDEGQEMIDTMFDNPRLDFHGFVPKDAIKVLKICLDKWWAQELHEREMNRQKLTISRALNVTPLEIVTGRGIHSAGGISTLKIKVRKFLSDQKYLFSEEPAYFIVQGRR